MRHIIISTFIFFVLSACSNKTAEEYYNDGITEGQNGNTKLAYKLFSKAIAKDKNYADAYAYRAFYGLEPQEKFDEALIDYNKAIDLAQNNKIKAFAFGKSGLIFLQQKNTKAAMININAALKLTPDDPLLYKNAALIMLEINNIDAFCGYLKLAIESGYTKKHGNDVQELYNANCLLK